MRARRRVLFFAEAVTLAHVGRPIALARALDPAQYEVLFACDPRQQRFIQHEPWRHLPLHSITGAQFLGALSSGRPVYDVATLRRYAHEDSALIADTRPDLIVGDFRLSLSVSARLAGIPYAAITNAYWSPHLAHTAFPLPVLPITRHLPLPLASLLFRAAQAVAFRQHCRPLNQLRQEHGLGRLGDDLRHVYTDADHALYADLPSMFPTTALPENHHFIGPILWSPPVPPPQWWSTLPADRPIVYLTLGSSGAGELLPTVLGALADRPLRIIVSTAGAPVPALLPANAHVADYLPGIEAAERASLVICNGGSPTSQQALAAGVPVLGIASNMDQFLNMAALVECGAGAVLRADRLSPATIRAAVDKLLAGTKPREAARALAGQFGHHPAPRRFAALVTQILTPSRMSTP